MAARKPKTETVEEQNVTIPGENEVSYGVRELNAGDTRRVGAMVAKVTGDSRLQNALMTGEQNVIIMQSIACVMERVPRDLALWCASLIGVEDNYDIQTYISEERISVVEDNKNGLERVPLTVGELRAKMESDIVAEMDRLPVGAYMDILAELMERDSFADFLASSTRFGRAISSLSTRFAKPSNENGDGATTK